MSVPEVGSSITGPLVSVDGARERRNSTVNVRSHFNGRQRAWEAAKLGLGFTSANHALFR